MSEHASGRRTRVLCGAVLGIVAFVYLLCWPPTLNRADESFTLYGAKRVVQGDALYHDFFDFIAPGSIYLYALAFAVGGVSITTGRVITTALHVVSVVCTYALALEVASIGEAALAGLLVLAICVPTFNLASHHWVATALGLATATVLLGGRRRASGVVRPALAGALAGALVASHQSRGVGTIVWLVLVVPVLALARAHDDARWRSVARDVVATAVGAALACGAILGFAVWHASFAEVLYATRTWVLESYRTYNVQLGRPWAEVYAPGFVGYTWLPLLRAEPWIMAAEAALIAWTARRGGVATVGVRTAIFLLALFAMASVLYFPDYFHVAIVTPYVLVVLAGMTYRTRAALGIDRLPRARAVLVAVWLCALGVVVAKAATNLERARSENPARIATAFGTIAGVARDGTLLRDLRLRLKVAPGRPAQLFSYPTDAWLYLTVPADNPTRYALLRPGYNTEEQFADAEATLRRHPDAAVVVDLPLLAPRDPFMMWMRGRYADTGVMGEGGPGYGFRLYVPTPWLDRLP